MDTLILSGGAIKGISTLGALRYLEERKYLTNINTFVGTSVGSIISYLLIIGYTSIEILSYILSPTFLEEFKYINITSLLKNEGVLDFSIINKHLKILTFNKIGTYLKMRDIRNIFKKRLICTTYNYTKKELVYIDSNKEEFDDIPCFSVLRMSSNIPILFSKFKYEDNFYIDGGIAHHYPCIFPKNSIGIFIDSINEESKDENLLSYIYNISHIPMKQIVSLSDKAEIHISLKISTSFSTLSNFSMILSTKEKMHLFAKGYIQCKNQLSYIRLRLRR